MATLSMPAAPGFVSSNFRLIANTQTFRSPLDMTVQTLELTGARWRGEFVLPPTKRPLAAPWYAFLAELNGTAGRFFGFDMGATAPRGTGGGDSPLVNGASQSGKSLNSKAWTINQTGLLVPGDFFQVGTELKMVTASVDSDGAGLATISFTPSLRASPADSAAITLNDPVCIMMLDSDDAANWDLNSAAFYSLSFVGIEAFQ